METAVDLETLDILAAHGIRFVVLAPHQCARVRKLPKAAKGAKGRAKQAAKAPQPRPRLSRAVHRSRSRARRRISLRHPACCRPTRRDPLEGNPLRRCGYNPALPRQLKDGRSIAAFFYDGPRSRAIAFEGLLNDGETFARRLLGGFGEKSDHSQLVLGDRRRELRPSSPLRRDGSRLGAQMAGKRRPGRAHRSGSSWRNSACLPSTNLRGHLMELRARRRAMAF